MRTNVRRTGVSSGAEGEREHPEELDEVGERGYSEDGESKSDKGAVDIGLPPKL
jgi:hypothetical protein